MREQLLRSGAPLPIELNMKLQEFAEKNEMVTFDPSSGVLKFKSDLLFDPGRDQVKNKSASALKALCKIMLAEEGKNLDILIAGHTDDQPISASKARHPTNWHLSVHRALAVLQP